MIEAMKDAFRVGIEINIAYDDCNNCVIVKAKEGEHTLIRKIPRREFYVMGDKCLTRCIENIVRYMTTSYNSALPYSNDVV